MGFISDQIGLLNRYFRESEEWKEHLDNSAGFILTCLRNKKIKELIVLGSGWLLDFPLENLIGIIERIKLVDIIHPPQILKKIKNFPGVECIPADITGGYVEKFYLEVKRFRRSGIPFFFEPGTIRPEIKRTEDSFVISLNILNQIDTFLIDYLKQKISIDEKTILDIRRKIQNDHINLLRDGRYILITDHDELIINRQKQGRTIKSLLSVELPASRYIKEWLWMFDSKGTYNCEGQTILKIRAMCSECPEIQ